MLVVENEITLSTRYGSSQVQLLLGDITDLPMEEKVDIIFTSAFPGDYSLISGTLIHALYKKLDIRVGKLAKDKELDLTRVFSCWMSKPLPPDVPFRRLVCFEVMRYQSLAEQISMMFRAIMPIFNGNEHTVITPVLATGNQGADMEGMVGVMVNTACHWIKAGLPLKCLKLVLYTRDEFQARNFQYTSVIKLFSQLKEKWEAKEVKMAMTRSLDVTFCYHANDKNLVSDICETIFKEDKSLTIHKDVFKMDEGATWQDAVFEVMSSSGRIVIALTPSFVSDKWCLEQFSLAMCCNRYKGVEMVIPFYLITVEAFPSYMNLVQYQNCRSDTDTSETAEDKILSACKDLVKAVKTNKISVEIHTKQTHEMGGKKTVPVYDVFISYSHRTSDIAHAAVKVLSKQYPDVKVFFDRSELKTGNLWQQALYEAVDQTHCMVAMLSDAYIQSTVCQEEYNISLARRVARDDFMLVPVCLSELSTFPESYTRSKPVIISNESEMVKLIDKIMPYVLKLKKLPEQKEKETAFLEDVLKHQRYLKFSKEFVFDWDLKEVLKVKENNEDHSATEARISFSYTADGMKFAAILSEMLQEKMPLCTCNLLSFSEIEARSEIDNADMIVIFVSNEFLRSQHHAEELHIALCRQRLIKDRTVIYLVEVSPIDEGFYYASILPFQVSLCDKMWLNFSSAFEFKIKRFNVNTKGMQGTYMCSSSELTALQMITKDVMNHLSLRGQGSEVPVNLVNVARIQTENDGDEDKNVTPKEVALAVKSFNPRKAYRNRDEDECLSVSESEAREEEKKSPNSSSVLRSPGLVTSAYTLDKHGVHSEEHDDKNKNVNKKENIDEVENIDKMINVETDGFLGNVPAAEPMTPRERIDHLKKKHKTKICRII